MEFAKVSWKLAENYGWVTYSGIVCVLFLKANSMTVMKSAPGTFRRVNFTFEGTNSTLRLPLP